MICARGYKIERERLRWRRHFFTLSRILTKMCGISCRSCTRIRGFQRKSRCGDLSTMWPADGCEKLRLERMSAAECSAAHGFSPHVVTTIKKAHPQKQGWGNDRESFGGQYRQEAPTEWIEVTLRWPCSALSFFAPVSAAASFASSFMLWSF